MAQNYTSAATSINKTRLPAVYGKVAIPAGSTVLDYGCGRYTDHIRAALPETCQYIPYDPYNLPESKLPESVVDVAICSNVLNVIDDDETVNEILSTLSKCAKAAYITVYTGDNSGVGRATGIDQYQRNEPLSAYRARLEALGIRCTMKNGVIRLGVAA